MIRIRLWRSAPVAPLMRGLLAGVFFLSSSALLFAGQARSSPVSLLWKVPYLRHSPVIDGSLEEWEKLRPMLLGMDATRRRHQVVDFPAWGGPLDCSAKGWLGWDKRFLYFAVEVTDNTFYQDRPPEYISLNDSLALVLDVRRDTRAFLYREEDDRELWWALVGERTISFYQYGRGSPTDKPKILAAARKKPGGGGWTCEVAIPWEEIGVSAKMGLRLGFTWVVADSDSGQYEGWLGWAPGVWVKEGKAQFATLTLVAPSAEVARAYDAAAEYRRLLDHCRSAKDLTPAQALLWSGHVHAFFGRLPLARLAYQKVLERYSEQAEAGAALAGLVEIAKRGQQADRVRQICLKASGKHPGATPVLREALWQIFASYCEAREWEKAKEFFGEMAKSLSAGIARSQAALYYAAACSEREPISPSVKEFLTTYVENAEEALAVVKQARRNYWLQRGALLYLEAMLEQCAGTPGENLARMEMGNIYFASSDYARAAEAFDEVARRAAGSLLGKEAFHQAAFAHYEAGNSAFLRQEYAAAIPHLQAALQDEAWKAEWWLALQALAQCYEGLRRYEEAIPVWQRLIDLSPKIQQSRVALFRIGECYRLMLRWEEAIEKYQELLRRYPEDKVMAHHAQNRIRFCEEQLATGVRVPPER